MLGLDFETDFSGFCIAWRSKCDGINCSAGLSFWLAFDAENIIVY